MFAPLFGRSTAWEIEMHGHCVPQGVYDLEGAELLAEQQLSDVRQRVGLKVLTLDDAGGVVLAGDLLTSAERRLADIRDRQRDLLRGACRACPHEATCPVSMLKVHHP